MKPVPEMLPFVVLRSPDLGAVVVHVPVDSAYAFEGIEIGADSVVLVASGGGRHVLDGMSAEALSLLDGDVPVFVEHSDVDGEGFPETWYPVVRAAPAPSFGG